MIGRVLINTNRKLKVFKSMPYKIALEMSNRCPYTDTMSDHVIKCSVGKGGFGCQPTALCGFVINTEEK